MPIFLSTIWLQNIHPCSNSKHKEHWEFPHFWLVQRSPPELRLADEMFHPFVYFLRMAFYEVVWKWLHFDVTTSVRVSFISTENITGIPIKTFCWIIYNCKSNCPYVHPSIHSSSNVCHSVTISHKMFTKCKSQNTTSKVSHSSEVRHLSEARLSSKASYLSKKCVCVYHKILVTDIHNTLYIWA